VPGVDEMLIAPTAVGNQLYELVAEERACVAAREGLGKALDRGRVGVESWVKGVRGVAREEFLKKWLAGRIGEGLGLHGMSGGDVGAGGGVGAGPVVGQGRGGEGGDAAAYYR